ncbi:MAG: enoyl-CoA hydratase/isomerase family protein [Deltaproteobacteria bacterium]|nr:enoyl-CoA hydratase/isomerase family protein [Deltaproteobacteria bacterium]
MSYEVLNFEVKDSVAYVTMNRPEAMNALNRKMTEEIIEACEEISARDDIRAAIITGAGSKAFSAGLDLKERAAEEVSIVARRQARHAPKITAHHQAIASVKKPVIAAVNGYAVGGGLEIALACDIRIGSTQARLGLTEVRRGMIPGAGGTQRLPRIIGRALALEMVLTGRVIDADEALKIGLLSRVVEPENLISAAESVAREVLQGAPLALQFVKEAVNRGMEMSLENGIKLEVDLSTMLRTTEDCSEGPKAFAEKRKPVWKGR